MSEAAGEDLETRLRRVEDELAIQRLVLGYGPAADAGLASLAASRWLDDGVYDWDGRRPPHQGREAVEAMLGTDAHRDLIGDGAAHVAGPVLIDVDGDRATAVHYSLILRHEDRRFYLWRVSAVRWNLEREDQTWRARSRTNRLLDPSGDGRELFETTLRQLDPEGVD